VTVQRMGCLTYFHYRTDHPRHRQSIQHHRRLLASVLSEATTLGLYRIGNIDTLHASLMVAVRETVPRRSARYRATVNNDSDPGLCVRVNRHNALKSSGTTPNFRNTVVSWKSPVAGSAVRLTVIPESQGCWLCIEGFLPFEEVPVPNPQSQPDRRLICLQTVRGVFPELIPLPWRDRT
jgi:hypothetical protein